MIIASAVYFSRPTKAGQLPDVTIRRFKRTRLHHRRHGDSHYGQCTNQFAAHHRDRGQ